METREVIVEGTPRSLQGRGAGILRWKQAVTHAATNQLGEHTYSIQFHASMGMIAPEEEDVLRKLVERRNAAAHGFSVRPLPDDVVPKALEIARALLQPEPAAA